MTMKFEKQLFAALKVIYFIIQLKSYSNAHNMCLYNNPSPINSSLCPTTTIFPQQCCKANMDQGIICRLKCNEDMEPTLRNLTLNNHTTIESLTFQLDYHSSGKYPITEPLPMNLTLLREFANVTSLTFETVRSYMAPVPLTYDSDTFIDFERMVNLSINIPLEDINLGDMIANMPNLEKLDFSNTKGLSMTNMTNVMRYITNGIRQLKLRNFQTIGAPGYNTSFDASVFFPTNFSDLVELDLSYNGFGYVYPGIKQMVPKLQYLDASHNLLVNKNTFPVAFEVGMHPTLEILKIGHQGEGEFKRYRFQYKSKYI